jgi:hypothetical protein
MDSSPLQTVQAILALQPKCGRPPQPTITTIASLKDLCELQANPPAVDWRRGAGGGQQQRPIFRNASGTSIASQGGRSTGGASTPMSGGPRSPTTPHPTTPGPPVRYQSIFKSATQVEDKILNNIILSKLNKFSGSTYSDIRDFLYQILGSGEPDLAEMIREFMMLVFKKAASEETYCPLYAKLLSEISSRYKVILEEMRKLQANYLEIFDDIVDPPPGEDYDKFVEKNKEKRYRLGYSQFLAELAGLEILELSNLEKTFAKIFDLMLRFGKEEGKRALLEEYADCLVRMSRVLAKKMSPFFVEARATLLRNSAAAMTEFLQNKDQYPSLSPKARFNLMDVKDNLTGV